MTHDVRRTIRSILARLGAHAAPQQVVDAMQAYGVEVSKKMVIQVKSQMLRDQAQALREQAKRPPQNKARSRPQQRKVPRRG